MKNGHLISKGVVPHRLRVIALDIGNVPSPWVILHGYGHFLESHGRSWTLSFPPEFSHEVIQSICLFLLFWKRGGCTNWFLVMFYRGRSIFFARVYRTIYSIIRRTKCGYYSISGNFSNLRTTRDIQINVASVPHKHHWMLTSACIVLSMFYWWVENFWIGDWNSVVTYLPRLCEVLGCSIQAQCSIQTVVWGG